MTSLLPQAKVQAFTAGCAAAAALYVATRTYVYEATQATSAQLPGAPPPKPVEVQQAPEPFLGATARAWAVRQWNEGVDTVFKPVVTALSRRNL